MLQIALIVLVTFITLPALCQKITISGVIQDVENGEALIGATIYDLVNRQGTVTNNYGFFSYTLEKRNVDLVFSFVGYQPFLLKKELIQDTTIYIKLNPLHELQEVIIEGHKTDPNYDNTQMGSVHVPLRQIKSMPPLMGEVDVLKVIQLLPGVQSGTEGASGIYVRGGGPDQNLILYDGVPVYNVTHLFGFFSVFNADAINHVELIKGGFPARYGGRLSSVIDIKMKEGNMKKIQAEGAIGLIASKLTLEGPITRDKTSFLVSGRRTYLDFLTKPFIRNATHGNNMGYYFYDLNGKINHIINEKNRLYFSFYNGDDVGYSNSDRSQSINQEQIRNRSAFGINWGNTISAIRWNHIFTNKLFANFTGTYTRYNFRIFSEQERFGTNDGEEFNEFYSSDYRSGILDYGLKMDFDYIPNSNQFIKFGANYIFHEFSPGVFESISKDDSIGNLGGNQTYAREYALYAENDHRVNSMLKINIGLHLSGFLVEDQHYYYLQPRLSSRYRINETSSIKASLVTMAQYIHLLTNAGLGLPTDLWVPATAAIGPQRSWQGSVGYYNTSRKSGVEWNIEAYYKEMDGLIEYEDGASFVSVEKNWEEKVEIGKGRSFGVEMFVQRKVGKTTGWVGYTLSKTERLFENINFNQWFPFRYDRTHDVSLTLSHHLSDKIHLSGTWVYGTGNAISFPTTVYKSITNPEAGITGGIVEHYESRNNFRMRDYHRLDLGVSFIKEKKWGTRSWNISIYNVYNRMNPFFVDIGFNSQTGSKALEQYSLFPFLPSVSYGFKF